MFKFNELSILNNKLVIDLQVEDEFEDYYIQSVSVSNQKDYNESATSGEGKYSLYDFDLAIDVCDVIYDETGSKEKQIDSYMSWGDNPPTGDPITDYNDIPNVGEEIIVNEVSLVDEPDVWETYAQTKMVIRDKIESDDYITLYVESIEQKLVGESWEPYTDFHSVIYNKSDLSAVVEANVIDEQNEGATDYFQYIYIKNIEVPVYKTMYKHIKIILSGQDFHTVTQGKYTLSDLLFIYALAQYDGEGETLPCGEKEWTVHPIVDMLPFYCRGMNFVKSLGDTCNIPREFIDYILMYKAFELSLYTGNYPNAIQYFNDFKRVKSNNGIQVKQRRGGGCGCH